MSADPHSSALPGQPGDHLPARPRPRPRLASAYEPPEELARLQRRAWLVGGAGAVALALAFFLAPDRFFRAYLLAWVFWTSVAAGCLALYMLHHVTRGAWGLMIRRPLEAATRTLPLLLLLFAPLAFGLDRLYLWARPGVVAGDPLLQHKAIFLNPAAFIGRTIAYFAIWYAFAWILSKWSFEQDRSGDPRLFRKMQMWAAPGLGAYCLATTFAGIDWLMSLDPHWFSSIYGVYFIGSQVLAALAFVTVIAAWLSRRPPLAGVIAPRHFHDYGKLLLAFVMLWTYFALSQFLIIWSANLPEETGWYAQRLAGGYRPLALGIALLHFALPFLLLLSRDLKRDARRLAWLALLLLAMRWLDFYWQAAPAFAHLDGHGGGGAHQSAGAGPLWMWVDLAALAALGGIWFAIYCWQLRKRNLLPIHDPYLEEALGDD